LVLIDLFDIFVPKSISTGCFMEKVEQIIDTLRTRIEQLVEDNRKLKKHVSELMDESTRFKALSEDREKALEDLSSRSQAITAARHLRENAGSEQARNRIDELVREIDKCINLLNR
jgi:DNA repair exonuclease SbcCD ATPase subunit